MNILGVIMTTNSTAALMKNGVVVACASEERFNRQKNTYDYPAQAIEYCLRQGGLEAHDLDLIAFVGHRFPYIYWVVDKQVRFSIADKVREQHLYWKPRLYEGKSVRYLDVFKDKIVAERLDPDAQRMYRSGSHEFSIDPRKELIQKHLDVKEGIIKTFPHHESHAYYGLYGSPFRHRDCLIFTIEGWGDTANASVAIYSNQRIRFLSLSWNCLIGRLYRYMTLVLGMNYDEHEYKVMGLAPYASAIYAKHAYDVFAQTMYVKGLKFAYRQKPQDTYFWFKDRLEGVRFDGIAGGLQRYVEEILCQWVSNAIQQTGVRDIVFTGGVAMNCKALLEVSKLPEVRRLHVCPTPSDESLAMGVCYLAAAPYIESKLRPVASAYLGPEFSDEDVRNCMRERGLVARYKIESQVSPAVVARKLADGDVIGVCRGRMEFGARALGNRSILASPTDLAIVRKLNRKIKRRDFWMPFAPVILKEREHDYLLNSKKVRHEFMTVASETTPLAHRDLAAALHPADQTARPQVLNRRTNPRLYDLIKAFETITGVGALLNTSFNLHGEPIVLSPDDAIDVFERSALDHLLLNDTLISKPT